MLVLVSIASQLCWSICNSVFIEATLSRARIVFMQSSSPRLHLTVEAALGLLFLGVRRSRVLVVSFALMPGNCEKIIIISHRVFTECYLLESGMQSTLSCLYVFSCTYYLLHLTSYRHIELYTWSLP